MIKQSIDIMTIDEIIEEKIQEYISKYYEYPKYIKMPLWIFNCMKKYMSELIMSELILMKIDYETEQIKYKNLIICETITIEFANQIEVF